MKAGLVVGILLLFRSAFADPNAVIVNLRDRDVSRVAPMLMELLGTTVYSGKVENPSKGVPELEYEVETTSPTFDFQDSEALVSFQILRANVKVPKASHKFKILVLPIHAKCKNFSAQIRPESPVGVKAKIRLEASEGEVRVHPISQEILNKQGIRFKNASSCSGFFPLNFLVKKIAGIVIRKELGKLDQHMLAAEKKTASKLNNKGGVFPRRLEVPLLQMVVSPQSVQMGNGAMQVSFGADFPDGMSKTPISPITPPALLPKSYLAISYEFLENVLTRLVAANEVPISLSDGAAEVLHAEPWTTLVPALRDLPSDAKFFASLALNARPEIKFETDSEGKITLRLGSTEAITLNLFAEQSENPTLLTSFAVTPAVSLAPQLDSDGKMELRFHGNAWKARAEGINLSEEELGKEILRFMNEAHWKTPVQIPMAVFFLSDALLDVAKAKLKDGYIYLP
jgi:hypothetical protein